MQDQMIIFMTIIVIAIYLFSGLILMTKYGKEVISMDEVKYAYRDYDVFSKMLIIWPHYLPKWIKIRKTEK